MVDPDQLEALVHARNSSGRGDAGVNHGPDVPEAGAGAPASNDRTRRRQEQPLVLPQLEQT